MTRKEKLKLLQTWQRTYQELDAAQDAVRGIIDINSWLFDKMFRMQSEYTKVVALAVGDTDDWCEWFAAENEFGAKGFEAAPSGGKRREIRSTEDLLTIIEESA